MINGTYLVGGLSHAHILSSFLSSSFLLFVSQAPPKSLPERIEWFGFKWTNKLSAAREDTTRVGNMKKRKELMDEDEKMQLHWARFWKLPCLLDPEGFKWPVDKTESDYSVCRITFETCKTWSSFDRVYKMIPVKKRDIFVRSWWHGKVALRSSQHKDLKVCHKLFLPFSSWTILIERKCRGHVWYQTVSHWFFSVLLNYTKSNKGQLLRFTGVLGVILT